MEFPRNENPAASNDSLDDSMQFNTNYSIIARDEKSFIRRNNVQTTRSSLVGIEMDDISWMVPDEISLFQSKIMSTSTSRLPPEGAEKKMRVESKNESLELSNLSDCSQYKELLQLVNKYDLEDVSVSEVPDKILPPVGGQSYRDRISKHQTEGEDISVPSTEQLLALIKASEGLTPTKIYDRIMESSYPKKADSKLSESDMDITTCGWTPTLCAVRESSSRQTFKVPARAKPAQDKDSDLNPANNTFGDESFVAMSNSILDRDEKSVMEKYGGLAKQIDITCPVDQPSLPWNVSNVTIFDLDTTGSLPHRRFENPMKKVSEGDPVVKDDQQDASQLDDLAERIYNLSPSTSFSAISKMILGSTRAPGDSSAIPTHVTGKR